MIDVQPLSDLVMVRVEDKRVEKSGLVLPKEVQPDLEEGRAVAFGPDVPETMRYEVDLCEGGVLFPAFEHEAKAWVKDGRKYLFIPAKDIMAAAFPGEADRLPRIQAALGRWVMMEWEEAKDTLLGGLLVRPVQRAKAHFTGTVILAGPRADDVERGKRYFFEQFSEFKSWTENGKRYAFVPMSAIYCEIPEREAEVHLAPSEVASPEFVESMR